ncbi:hypothetical protein L6164_018384 [Bauhinia variegata]|uniref:Uncharacterized protein n=1 Tax=Bauhinia variegata TaxID=167791 RepID=A0ACB9NBM2_BAUVA|nr:hypothetical protein L6164_018384 [Bauhinia variegata]
MLEITMPILSFHFSPNVALSYTALHLILPSNPPFILFKQAQAPYFFLSGMGPLPLPLFCILISDSGY